MTLQRGWNYSQTYITCAKIISNICPNFFLNCKTITKTITKQNKNKTVKGEPKTVGQQQCAHNTGKCYSKHLAFESMSISSRNGVCLDLLWLSQGSSHNCQPNISAQKVKGVASCDRYVADTGVISRVDKMALGHPSFPRGRRNSTGFRIQIISPPLGGKQFAENMACVL